MQLLAPLKQELADNFELANATEQLIENERDMLQGETEKRVMLFSLSTDVWRSVLNAGDLKFFGEDAEKISLAYRYVNELNTVIEKFNQFGDRIMYTPLLKATSERYERKQLLDVIKEMSAEAATQLMHAQEVVDELIRTECPVCNRRFPSRKAMKSHVTQKDDPEHVAYQEKIR